MYKPDKQPEPGIYYLKMKYPEIEYPGKWELAKVTPCGDVLLFGDEVCQHWKNIFACYRVDAMNAGQMVILC